MVNFSNQNDIISNYVVDRYRQWYQAAAKARYKKFYKEITKNGVSGKICVDFAKSYLGKQDGTFTGQSRSWVWKNDHDGWILFVSGRGMYFEIYKGSDPVTALHSFINSWNSKGLASIRR